MKTINNLWTLQKKYIPSLILLFAGISMAAITWQKWGDLVIDFGLQAYIPWQISEGQVLHNDLIYFNGPLSVYLHALVFKVFGPGISILSWFNIFLVGCLTAVIFKLFIKLADTLTAFIAGFIFITLFAFSQYTGGGDYNFINPYTYELPHGVILSFFAIYQLMKYLENPVRGRIITLGISAGMVFLTKPEASLAAFTAVIIGFLIAVYSENISYRTFAKKISWFVLSLGIPPLSFFIYFSFHMSMVNALKATLGQWAYVVGYPSFRNLPYYQWVRGTDFLWQNISTIFFYGFIFTITAALAFFINHKLRQFSGNINLLNFLLSLLVIGTLQYFSSSIPLLELLRPLPLFMIGFGIYLIVMIKKNFRNRAYLVQKIPLFTLTIFSFVLMFKMIFRVHIYHYGFALAMPATMVLIVIMVYEIPLWIKKVSLTNKTYRVFSLAIIIAAIFAHVNYTYWLSQLKGYPVASGRDLILDYRSEFNPRGKIFNQALEFINQEMDADQTFATFPSTMMMNYLARRRDPIKTLGYNAGTWMFLGENYVMDLLKKSPPLYVVFIDRDFSGLGFEAFGKDFGGNIFSWVHQNYESVRLFGDPPFSGKGFGIEIFKRPGSIPDSSPQPYGK